MNTKTRPEVNGKEIGRQSYFPAFTSMYVMLPSNRSER